MFENQRFEVPSCKLVEDTIIVGQHRIQVITSKHVCHILLIVGCLQNWYSLKQYLFFEYFDGIVRNFVLKLNLLYMSVGNCKVVFGEQSVISCHFGECQSKGRLCLVS